MDFSVETNKASIESQTGDDGMVTEPKKELEAHQSPQYTQWPG